MEAKKEEEEETDVSAPTRHLHAPSAQNGAPSAWPCALRMN